MATSFHNPCRLVADILHYDLSENYFSNVSIFKTSVHTAVTLEQPIKPEQPATNLFCVENSIIKNLIHSPVALSRASKYTTSLFPIKIVIMYSNGGHVMYVL